MPTADDERIADILHATRRIAVIGASSRPGRPSYGVFRTLLDYGYDCVPVNPKEATVHGVAAFATLEEAAAATGPFDMVDVFRRADLVVPHAHEAVAIGARCFWLQLGIVNWEAATIAIRSGGVEVVIPIGPFWLQTVGPQGRILLLSLGLGVVFLRQLRLGAVRESARNCTSRPTYKTEFRATVL